MPVCQSVVVGSQEAGSEEGPRGVAHSGGDSDRRRRHPSGQEAGARIQLCSWGRPGSACARARTRLPAAVATSESGARGSPAGYPPIAASELTTHACGSQGSAGPLAGVLQSLSAKDRTVGAASLLGQPESFPRHLLPRPPRGTATHGTLCGGGSARRGCRDRRHRVAGAAPQAARPGSEQASPSRPLRSCPRLSASPFPPARCRPGGRSPSQTLALRSGSATWGSHARRRGPYLPAVSAQAHARAPGGFRKERAGPCLGDGHPRPLGAPAGRGRLCIAPPGPAPPLPRRVTSCKAGSRGSREAPPHAPLEPLLSGRLKTALLNLTAVSGFFPLEL